MKLLIVGGTRFLGRHLAQQALDAGHRVTLFHRGQSNASAVAASRAPHRWLLAARVAPWTELPLWVPAEAAGLHAVDLTRARAAGLVCRPLEDTLHDTAAWAAQASTPLPPAIGLNAEREAELLAR